MLLYICIHASLPIVRFLTPFNFSLILYTRDCEANVNNYSDITAETAVVCPIGIDTTVYQYAEYRLPVHLARDEVAAVGFFILQQRF